MPRRSLDLVLVLKAHTTTLDWTHLRSGWSCSPNPGSNGFTCLTSPAWSPRCQSWRRLMRRRGKGQFSGLCHFIYVSSPDMRMSTWREEGSRHRRTKPQSLSSTSTTTREGSSNNTCPSMRFSRFFCNSHGLKFSRTQTSKKLSAPVG